MFTVGQFSRICRVTTKALRHYDEIGLLKPARSDPVTQYRYYTPEQIAAWRRISLFKELGFGLPAIRELMGQPMDAAALAAALEDQALRLRDQLAQGQLTLDRVNREISLLRAGDTRSFDAGGPQVKDIPAALVCSVRDRGPYPKIGRLFAELVEYTATHRLEIIGPGISIYHDREYRPLDADLELCVPVRRSDAATGRITVKELPACRAVSCLHVGDYEQLGETYARVFEFVAAHNLAALDPSRDVYLVGPKGVRPEEYVTEVLLPVR